MEGYPGLSSFYQNELYDLMGGPLHYFGAVIMLAIAAVIIYFSWQKFRWEDEHSKGFILLGIFICIILGGTVTWFGQPSIIAIPLNEPGLMAERKAIKEKDFKNWQYSLKLDTTLIRLEDYLSQMGSDPIITDMENSAKQFLESSSVTLKGCRVVNAQLVTPLDVSGGITGHLKTGGIFSRTTDVNFRNESLAIPGLEKGEAIVLWVQHNSEYIRLVLPSVKWTELQLDLIKEKYYPRKGWHYTHNYTVFGQHYPNIKGLVDTLISNTSGNINSIWALINDEKNQKKDLVFDITSLSGLIAEDTYYVDNLEIRNAAHIPGDTPLGMSFPGKVSLSMIEAITADFLKPFRK